MRFDEEVKAAIDLLGAEERDAGLLARPAAVPREEGSAHAEGVLVARALVARRRGEDADELLLRERLGRDAPLAQAALNARREGGEESRDRLDDAMKDPERAREGHEGGAADELELGDLERAENTGNSVDPVHAPLPSEAA
mgnify:CR=1 FL=1